MKSRPLLIATVALLFVSINGLMAQSFKVKNYSMTISGTSTMHTWQSTVERAYLSGSFVVADNSLTEVKGVVVKIPVASIKSTKGKTMDNKTYEAFNYATHSQIVFVMNSSEINEANSTIDLKGTLTMAGTTRPVVLKVNYQVLPHGELRIWGSKQLLMTEFGMEPPTAMMGAIKVGDSIAVSFEMTLSNSDTIL